MSREPILIVGGGLGGLTAALALARRGRTVRVLEGATEFGAIGYGIQFGPNVFHVFDRLGLTEQVMAVADSPPAPRFAPVSNTPTSSSIASTCITCCSMPVGRTTPSSSSPMRW
jgi:2-polyprenyl-6-methoxyphenol hydroxylase-like FAD-dependent oxidoreductase